MSSLTVAQKKMIDEVALSIINACTESAFYTRDEMMKKFNSLNEIGYTNVHIINGFKRVMKTYVSEDNRKKTTVEYDSGRKVYHIYKGYTLDWNNRDFVKDKNLLKFGCFDGLTYDFIKKEFNMDYEKVFINYRCGYSDFFSRSFISFLDYEWLFNYFSNMDMLLNFASSICGYLDREALNKMPQSLGKELKEGKELTDDLFFDCYCYDLYGKNFKVLERIWGRMPNSNDMDIIKKSMEILPVDKASKILKNSFYNGDDFDWSCVRGIYRDIVELIKKGIDTEEIKKYIDDNRDFEHNKESLKELKDREKNEKLAKQLQKLNFINNMQYKNLTVVVPQNQTEKVAEGKMQNNCVGYYYDDSIINGRNFIYFIRKTDNVNHSYITCRYNMIDNETVEYRAFNNDCVRDNTAITFISMIDKVIKENREQLR